jgi:ligand-binding sensor domain-containing protein
MVASVASAQQWEVVNPSTTGIPGEEVRVARFAPSGDLWVGARWPFWTQGGIGIYDFKGESWQVHSNVPDSPTGGFPSAFVNDIEFAGDGTVWVATSDGLAHFRAGQWHVHTSANSPMPYHDVLAIDLDTQGRVWMNARRGPQYLDSSVLVFDGTSWQSWAVGNGIPWPTPWEELNGMLVDSNDHVWVGNSTQNGLAEFDGQTWTIHGENQVPPLRGAFEDANGDLWAIAENLGYTFYRYDGQTWETFSSSNTPLVRTTTTAMGLDDQGRVLVSNWAGQVIRQTSAGSSTFELIAEVGVRAYNLMPQPNGDLWLTTPGAVRHLDANGVQLEAFNTYNTGLPDYFVDRFSVDRQGNLWVATGEGGISRFDGQRWRNWGNHNAGSEPYPWAGNEPMGGFYLDTQGRGWMGGNGVGLWDPARGTFINFWNWQNTPVFGVTMFTHFAEDLTGTIFTATENGSVFSFDGAGWSLEPASPGSYTSTFAGIEADGRGHVFAAQPFDIWEWDGRAWTTIELPYPEYLFDLGGVSAFAIGPDDTLWIGTNDGLVRYDGGFRLFDQTNSPLPAKQVRGVDVAPDGRVGVSSHEFLATTPFPSGVAVIEGDPTDPTNWATYGYGTHPIPHYQLGPVVWDARGDLWVSAISEGVAVLRTERGCYADCDGNGALDVFDFLCFQDAFTSAAPYADCDGNGALDVFDFLCFQDAFVQGCE